MKYLFLIVVLATAGCQPVVVEVERMVFPPVDLPEFETVSVIEVEDYYRGDFSGIILTKTLINVLNDRDLFTVLDHEEATEALEKARLRDYGVSDGVLDNPQKLAKIATALGVEGLIFGQILGYEITESTETEETERTTWTGRYGLDKERELRLAPDIFGAYVRKERVYDVEMVTEVFTVKQGTMEVRFAIVDASLGEIVYSSNEKVSFEHRTLAQSNQPVEDTEAIISMARSACNQFVTTLLPQRFIDYHVLETGTCSYTKKGVEYAKNDLWKDAVIQWEKALKKKPHKAAASYNLGIAYEREGNYAEAAQYYSRAASLVPDSQRYMESLFRMQDILENRGKQ